MVGKIEDDSVVVQSEGCQLVQELPYKVIGKGNQT